MTHFYDTIIQTPVQLPKSLPLTLLDFESKRNLFFIEIAFCFVTMTLINYVSLSVLSMKLPSKLGKEPLVTVLFEIRFTAKLALSNILPGILFSKLGCENIEPTPHAQIPEQIRRADPNLKYLPLVALKWQRYQVLVGDSSVVLSCDIPYLGWTDFRTHILSLINELEQTKLISEVERYSLKYVDVIENVQNFLKHSITYGKYKGSIISVIKRKFSNKYNIEHGILNAKDYGVPQVRKRAFIIMKKQGEPRFPIKEKEVTVHEAIGHLKSIEAIIREEIKVKDLNKLDVQDYHFSPTHCFRHIECMRHTPTGKSAFENKVYYPKKLDGTKVKGYNTAYKRMKWDAPAPTITTANGVLSSQCNVHPGIRKNDGTYSDARVLSLKEIIILFSVARTVP